MKKSKKKNNLSDLISNFGKSYGISVAGVDNRSNMNLSMKSGIDALDILLGGFPEKGIVEIAGNSATGKSTFSLGVIREAQKMGGFGFIIDSECAMTDTRLLSVGVDPSGVLLDYPEYIEKGFARIRKFSKQFREDIGPDAPIVMVWDTLASVPTKKAFDEMEDKEKNVEEVDYPEDMGRRAKIIRQGMQMILPVLMEYNVLVILVNHITANIGGYGDNSPGGTGMKYYPNLRLKLSSTKSALWSNECGTDVDITVIKSRLCRPFVKLPVAFIFRSGFDGKRSLLYAAATFQDKKDPIIKVSRGRYYLNDIYINTQGGDPLELDNDIEKILRKFLMNKIAPKKDLSDE